MTDICTTALCEEDMTSRDELELKNHLLVVVHKSFKERDSYQWRYESLLRTVLPSVPRSIYFLISHSENNHVD